VIASQFRVLRKLGAGGMGAVFLAEQIDMERKVVVKVLHPELTHGNPVAIERFRREAKAVAQLNHPNIVQVFVFGQAESGQMYLAMEYIEGRDLASELTPGPMAQPRALRILDQVCAALIEAHGAGIVHRDLKPENIMLADRHGNPDYVKVLDFGIAKLHDSGGGNPTLTQAGSVFGTPRYMSPEQVKGEPVDARSDIYALGIILYEMLVGRHPFEANSTIDYLMKHVSEAVVVPTTEGLEITPRIEAILLKCLEKDPADRFQSVAELQREVRVGLRDFSEAIRGFPSSQVPLPAIAAGKKAAAGVPKAAPGTQPPVRGTSTYVPPGTPSKKGIPAWVWAIVAVVLVGGIVGLVLALKPPGPNSLAGGELAVKVPEGETPKGTTGEGKDPSEAKDPEEGHDNGMDPEEAKLAEMLKKAGVGEGKLEEALKQFEGDDGQVAALLQKLAADDPQVAAMLKQLGDGGVLDAGHEGGSPTEGAVPTTTVEEGEPIDGFPLPKGARATTSAAQMEMFETALGAREVIGFYKAKLHGKYTVKDVPNGLMVESQDSPFSYITVQPNGDVIYLVLSRNALAEKPQKPSGPPPPAFGVEFPDDASMIVRSEQAIVMRSRKAHKELCDWYESKYGSIKGVMVMRDLESSYPSCTIAAATAEDTAWMAIAIMKDPNSAGAMMISVVPRMH
jgi:serine/threonine protein kinase